MTKIIGYTLMILLSGGGAALSAVNGAGAASLRAFILGTILALSIVVGDYYIRKQRYTSKFAQAMIGMFFGLIAGMLIILIDDSSLIRYYWPRTSRFMPNTHMIIGLIIGLASFYGICFQWIIINSTEKRLLKLFMVSYICIIVKECYRHINWLYYGNAVIEILILSVIGALIFVSLWYLPIWFFYIKKNNIISCIKCIPLNFQMLKLVWKERWLSKHDYAVSYDKVAATYDEQWLCQLRPVTEKLLGELLPAAGQGDILDLGCGTGFSTQFLDDKFPETSIIGVDISPEMLNIAREKCSRAEFVEGDILEFLKSRPDDSASLIFSGWAIGYSKPADIISEARRILKPGGAFAFVVNYSDTLDPVFNAFRKCMNKFPGQVKMALWPKFPHEAKNLLKPLKKNGFATLMQEDGRIPIDSPEGEITLEWLLKTGVLAGFDQVMPLRDNPELIEYFNKVLREFNEPVEHHYFMGVFIKK